VDEAPLVELQRPRTRDRLALPLDRAGSCHLGSADSCEVVLAEDSILPRHARFRMDETGVRVEPCDGAGVAVNGQACDGPHPLADGDWLVLGRSMFAVCIRGAPAATPAPAPPSPVAASPAGLTIGRLPDNDLALDSPLISRRHARLLHEGGGSFLEDLGSTNGTFVDGQRIEGRVALRPGARVDIGTFGFLFDGTSLRELRGAGTIRLECRGLSKTVRDATTGRPRELLRDVALAIEPGEFAAIFGTSGSGKSTLLDALNGRRRASDGAVRYNGVDFYRSFDLFRASIAYVPQQDIVHRKITVRRALRYTARLRLPPDTSDREIDEYITRVLARVGLADKADQPIDTPAPLSGGQLKRVSLAVELVSNPSIVFLDEVTSGLDAGTDKKMMNLFAELAGDGKTVVCVTHTLENIDACHLVTLLHRGRLVFFGPPAEALDHFEVSRLSNVYELLEEKPVETWEDRYRRSETYGRYVESRLAPRTGDVAAPPPAAEASRGQGQAFRQGRVLTRRYVDLLTADRRNLMLLLAQAPIIGLVIGLVFETGGPDAERAQNESTVSFILVVSMIWFGCLNAAREVVKELPIYLRERAINLQLAPYLASKLGPLAAICLVQTVTLLAVVSALLDLSGSGAVRGITLFLAGMAATAMGLTVSALVDSNDKAVAAVPILLIPQVVLSGALVSLSGVSELLGKATMISYWAYAGMKQSLGDAVQAARGPGGQLVVPVEVGVDASAAALVGFFALFVAVAAAALKRKDRMR